MLEGTKAHWSADNTPPRMSSLCHTLRVRAYARSSFRHVLTSLAGEQYLPVNYVERQCNEWMKLGLQGEFLLYTPFTFSTNIKQRHNSRLRLWRPRRLLLPRRLQQHQRLSQRRLRQPYHLLPRLLERLSLRPLRWRNHNPRKRLRLQQRP